MQFTVGRDIQFDPVQQGDPFNYFIYPYAELEGKILALESEFSFRERCRRLTERGGLLLPQMQIP